MLHDPLIFTHVCRYFCVLVCVCWSPSLHWCVEPIWSAGWTVPEQSITWWFGSAHAATLSFPSHPCTDDVAPHTWCSLSVCLWVFDCSLLECVCVCEWGNEASSVWECVLPGECVCPRSGAYGHGDCHQPAWLRLLLPLCHLLDHSRCHIGTDRRKMQRAEKHTQRHPGSYSHSGSETIKWDFEATIYLFFCTKSMHPEMDRNTVSLLNYCAEISFLSTHILLVFLLNETFAPLH